MFTVGLKAAVPNSAHLKHEGSPDLLSIGPRHWYRVLLFGRPPRHRCGQAVRAVHSSQRTLRPRTRAGAPP